MLDVIVRSISCCLLVIEMISVFLFSLIEDKSYEELIKSESKLKYIWSKKSRITLLFTDFLDTEKYAELKKKFIRLSGLNNQSPVVQ
jgi:hypothetical protein